MASLGDLVVRIGADTRDLNKQLGRVQRNMRSMTSNFERLGQSMTRSVTLPLIGIGAVAVKSAADLETLETSFVSLTGGIEQARGMMSQLNEFTAKTPFQIDAVAKSARQLIASGTEISQVNDQLQFLGDIAATSGTSIDEIAAIFAKVRAKGKVELENLNQLAERGIPIFKALAEATGLPADKLGAGAVSVKQFEAVLKSFAEEGGFAAGAMERLSGTVTGKFSTAIDNLKIAGAALAESVMPAVTTMLDRVTLLAKNFTNLDPTIRALIVNFGLLASAIGPVLAFLPQIVTQVKLIMATISGGGIAIAIAAVTALVTTFATLRKEVVTIQDRLADAQREANAQAAESIANVRVLVAEYGRENTSMERKEQLLNQLQTISPRYYGHLKEATTTVDLLTAATNRYTESIKEQARQLAIQEAQEEQLKAIAQRQREVLEFERKRNTLLAEYDSNLDGILSLQERIDMGGFKTADFDLLTTQIRVGQQDVENMTAELIEFQNQFGNVGVSVNDLLKDLEAQGAQLHANTLAQNAYNDSVGRGIPHLNQAAHAITDFSDKANQARMTMGQFFSMLENTQVVGQTTQDTFDAMGNSFQQYVNLFSRGVDELITGSLTLKQTVVKVVKDIIIARLAETKANVLSGASSSAAAAGPAAPFVLPVALAGMMAIIDRINIPALAKGGVAFGPSLAMVGDNPNARIDPEVIAPLSKLRDMMGGQQIEVFGRISGNDIYITNERTMTARERYS